MDCTAASIAAPASIATAPPWARPGGGAHIQRVAGRANVASPSATVIGRSPVSRPRPASGAGRSHGSGPVASASPRPSDPGSPAAADASCTHSDPPRAISAPVSSVSVTSARAMPRAGGPMSMTVASVRSVRPGSAGPTWRSASSVVVMATPAGSSAMIAHAIAASAGMVSTPSGTRPSSAHSHPVSGMSNRANWAVRVTGRIPVRRASGGAGISPASMARRSSMPGCAARAASG